MTPKKRFTFDTETALITDENPIPRLTCLSWCDGVNWGLVDHVEACEMFIRALLDPQIYLVGHNIAFDIQVLAKEIGDHIWDLIFAAYDQNRIFDTLLIEKIISIKEGRFLSSGNCQKHKGKTFKFNLNACFKKYTGNDLEGKSTVRLGYGKLRGVPINSWSQLERAYALNDALATDFIYQQSQGDSYPTSDDLFMFSSTARGAFGLHRTSTNGIQVDSGAVGILDKSLTKQSKVLRAEILAEGLLKRGRKRGEIVYSKDLKKIRQAVSDAFKNDPPRSDKGNIKTDAETLAIAAEKNPVLLKITEFNGVEKLLSTYIKPLKLGKDHGIHAFFNPLVGTYRTSCGRPNLQNMPRKEGIRQCFVPKKGFLFCSVDYDTLELRTLSQANIDFFGFSKMGDALNSGIDPHLQMAAHVLRIDYKEALDLKKKGDPKIKSARQLAKAANFGYPGGAGAESFRKIAKGYGVKLTKNQAQTLKDDWFLAWPEMKLYFKHVGKICQSGSGYPTIDRIKATRGDVFFTESCNFYFQGLAAVGAKEALYAVTKATLMKENCLFGCSVVNFIHDELIVEVPDDLEKADLCAKEISKIMCEEMQKLVPDVKISAEPALMKRWEKGAEAVYNKKGLLTPWEK